MNSSMSPLEMFLFSIRTGRRLPDGIHENMLLWSFDEKHADVVKDYIKWVKNCEEREMYRERFKARMREINTLQNATSFLSGMFITTTFFYIFLMMIP